MGKKSIGEIASCYQCAGVGFCYGTKSPDISREIGRSKAKSCTSLRKGSPVETITVFGYKRGLSRGNAERLVENNYARWIGYKTIEKTSEFPVSIQKRLINEKENRNEKVIIAGY